MSLTPDPAALVWVGPIYEATGYADEARGLLTALEAQRIPVALRAVRERRLPGFADQLPAPMRAALQAQEAREVQPAFAVVQHFMAEGFSPLPAARLQIGRTMFETDGLPGDWVAKCNAMDALWLPSAFNVDSFRRAGVRVPMHIIPGGVDSQLFSPVGPRAHIADARACVFLSIFEWRPRKGWDVLLRAWADAFAPDEDVTLVLRCSVPGRPASAETTEWLSRQIDAYLREVLGRDRSTVAPIILLPDVITPRELPAVYRAATAYISPTRGEGWGRPFMEAMATGLPVIATRWSAPLSYMTDDTSFLVDVERLVPADDPEMPLYAGTQWAEPSVAHCARQLRRVFEDRVGSAAVGARARESMVADWSWERAATKVRDAFAELTPALRTPRPAVRAATHPCRLRPFPLAAVGHGDVSGPPPRLWFGMLTYNALAYTRRAIASLDRHTDEPWRLFILDNGSTDGTRAWLATLTDPRIEVVESPSNRGVAGGRNDIVTALRPRVPDDGFIVFVDNDLEFFPGWLDAFRRVIGQTPRLGMVSCSGFEMVVHAQHRELLSYPALMPLSVDVTSGGFACFVRPAVFDAIGGYDETLNPFWHEDDDLTVRARAAGFETMAAPGFGVVHHGHKSGAAIPALVHGGSRSKQAYLIEKWRRAGWVAPDGRLTPGRATPDGTAGDIAQSMATLMQRPGPCMASEVARARLDASLVPIEGDATNRQARYATAPALAWADVHAQAASIERLRWAPVAAQLRETLARRRQLTRLPDAAGPPPLSGLADARHWDDDAWFAMARDAAGDGRGRLQWYDRSASIWDATQVARAFQWHARRDHANTTGASIVPRRVLVIGDLRRPIVWHLAERTDSLIVGDILSRHEGGAGASELAHVERFALRDVPNDRVRALAIDALSTAVTPGSIDVAVILPWDPHAPLADVTSLMQFVQPLLAPTGWLCATVPVRLAGPPDQRALDQAARLSSMLHRLGLTTLDAPTLALSDAGHLAATDPAGLGSRTPDLLVVDGPRMTARLFVTARPAPGGAP